MGGREGRIRGPQVNEADLAFGWQGRGYVQVLDHRRASVWAWLRSCTGAVSMRIDSINVNHGTLDTVKSHGDASEALAGADLG